MTTKTKLNRDGDEKYFLGEVSGEEIHPMLEEECEIQVFDSYKALKEVLLQRIRNCHCEKDLSLQPCLGHRLVRLEQTKGDTWHKIYARTSAEAHEIIKRVTYEIIPVDVSPPGTHPGGDAWWIDPIWDEEEIKVWGLVCPDVFASIEDKSSLEYWNLYQD